MENSKMNKKNKMTKMTKRHLRYKRALRAANKSRFSGFFHVVGAIKLAASENSVITIPVYGNIRWIKERPMTPEEIRSAADSRHAPSDGIVNGMRGRSR
jgi:hypothetical protein